MNNEKKPARLKLELKDTNVNMILIGIVSSEPDYKLSLAINKKLNISLRLSNPVELSDRQGNIISFSRFADVSEIPDISYSLVSNRSESNTLLRKMKKMDYILSVSHSYPNLDTGKLISSIRETEGVNAAFLLDSSESDYRLFQI